MKNLLLILLVTVLLASIGCRKDPFITDASAKLTFSVDTLLFDTVFTTVGSITERIVVRNPHSQRINISRIAMEKGQGSNFYFNADGIKGKVVEDIEIPANDSIFVFIEVTVDPNGGNTPMVLEEKITFETNGNEQSVQLVAWGQDAYFYPSVAFTGGAIFELPNDKPHVFYGYSIVDTNTTLRIPCGTQVHFHPNGGLVVGHNASLKILGCENDPVVIQGDRLEDFFKEQPGQWQQILLSQTSVDNEIRNAIIKNGTLGVRVDSNVNENPTLILENTQILNMSFIGLLGQGARIEATNTVVADCGDHAVALAFGGEYYFNHCTFANFWNSNPRSKSTLLLNNYFEFDNQVFARDFSATIENSIIYGNLEEELEIDGDNGAQFDYLLDHCILKSEEETDDPDHFIAIVQEAPGDPSLLPIFANFSENDYQLSVGSMAIDKGKVTPLVIDIQGTTRDELPDLGAYEYVE